MDYLKRNKSKFSYASVRVVCEEVRTMFDATYSQYVMRKMMDAAGVPLKRNLSKKDFDVSLSDMTKAVNSIKIAPSPLREIKDQLDHMEKKIDFICDFIQYAKTGEVPQ
jgi:hypothetical protein